MLEGKKRELKQREDLFLSTARDIMVENGFHGLTMGGVASTAGFAKGTLYQRFSTKEHLASALWKRSLGMATEMIARAATLDASPRERIVAAGVAVEVFARLHREDARVLPIMEAEMVLARLPEDDQRALRRMHHEEFETIVSVAGQALKNGDFEWGDEARLRNMLWALWAMVDGCLSAVAEEQPVDEFGIDDPFEAAWEAADLLLDGYNWHPLSTEVDYSNVRQRVAEEFFPEYLLARADAPNPVA